MRVIIPAAGRGTRLNADSQLPKVMHSVLGRPLLSHVLDIVDFVDPKDIYVVVGYGKEAIMEHFGDALNYVEQREQLGTGHAVMVCADAFRDYDGTVLVTFGDMPLFRREDMQNMCRQHEQNRAACTLMTAENPDLTMWARVTRDAAGKFSAIVEGKDCTPEQAKIMELFAGVIAFDSRRLFEILPLLDRNNVQHEYYLTEVPQLMAARGMRVDTYMIADGGDLQGVNTPEDLRLTEAELRRRAAHGA